MQRYRERSSEREGECHTHTPTLAKTGRASRTEQQRRTNKQHFQLTATQREKEKHRFMRNAHSESKQKERVHDNTKKDDRDAAVKYRDL